MKNISSGAGDAHPSALAEVNGRLLFTAATSGTLRGVWATDGTFAGTVPLTAAPANVPSDEWALPVASGGRYYFIAAPTGQGLSVWASDGTSEGTAPVPGTRLMPRWLTAAGGTLYFVGHDNHPDGAGLWKTDGTEAGTTLVTRGVRVGDARDPRPVGVGSTVYFASTRGSGLWKTDGTAEGTALVADLNDSGRGAIPRNPTPFGDALLFTADPSGTFAPPAGLWRTDGTAAGTVRLTPEGVSPVFMGGRPLPVLDGYAYFGATDAAGVRAVWRTDGTPQGTARVQNLSPGHRLHDMAAAADLVFFATLDSNNDAWLWRTDGTPAGTAFVTSTLTAHEPIGLVGEVGRELLFTFASNGGRELWRTNGVFNGTFRVADIFPGNDGSYPQQFVPAGNDALYFTALDPLHGREVWKYTADPLPRAEVVGRHVFYNNSAYDGGSAGADPADDGAIATDKAALLPGRAASFTNVTSYVRGINGLMVDVANMPGRPLRSDFAFEVGTGGDPAGWRTFDTSNLNFGLHTRPLPDGGGVRNTLLLPDGVIRNAWLQVTVKANVRTGLADDEVFYFGNLAGDTGGRAPGAAARVDPLDLLRTRRALGTAAAVTNPYDHNRDGRVSAADYAITRANQGRRLGAISLPVPAPVPAPAIRQDDQATDLLH